MLKLIGSYYHWLHGKWPAGTVEKLPVVGEDGLTNVNGVRVVGDLSGVPLLKFSSETGTKAIRAIMAESSFPGERSSKAEGVYDVAIIGAGVSGISAAMEAKKAGLSYLLIEASQMFSTVANFPKRKPIFTYPTDMTPSGGIQYGERSNIKESLLEEMREQVEAAGIEITQGRIEKIEKKSGTFQLRNANAKDDQTWQALRVIVGIGRSGNFRKLGVPGEDMDKVMNRLHDPKDYAGKDVMVVGGGDSAAEAAIALAACGAKVTLSYRKPELNRPKPENIEKVKKLAENPCTPVSISHPTSERVTTAVDSENRESEPGCLTLALGSAPTRITDTTVTLKKGKGEAVEEVKNDAVFAMIGREAPLDFFRRSGINIAGDRGVRWWVTIIGALAFCIWLYHWKKYIMPGWNPAGLWTWIASLSSGLQAAASDESSFFYTLKGAASGRGFYYSLAYCLAVTIFGIRRMRRRRTPYVKWQTLTLASIQWIPLFLLPELLLPYLGRNGVFDSGIGAAIAQHFFPGESYWRAYGFVLAWPLAVFNWFTDQPIWGWLILGSIQTFVIIPWMIRRWGKGAYCGWICSCGALAETMGDAHRHKMPHGPKVNRLNMIGQVFLAFAAFIMIIRVLGWVLPDGNPFDNAFKFLAYGYPLTSSGLPILNYNYFVDLIFAGILGVAFYFHFSGRVWCRFACPLAALMHIYNRFSKFRIFAQKKKCISCNVCTSVCHQGIDIMNFANKGLPMEDPECVRCSACVQSCPTGVLQFGRYDKKDNIIYDTLAASPVQINESTITPVEQAIANAKSA
ncbi:NAD(P)-binding domain-containing protein [Rubellicoccus peritrichatus]|uniref:NAD(P)-binding domain-containing protein n=1 Tax=Rubellicoccus peritrichatus TaxID=3080537 RepID=A0AAQ3QU89_9BACT|nr:NAD(P)-binding domain-containing protein [Puniceicoccus sp. CR14]WOO39735.1 NAD(P)-binding domain-containing protein [Puniceicoccus sp. CR14]